MLVPFVAASMELVARGCTEPADVDKAWTIGTGATPGPFQILDIIGLLTLYNILASESPGMQQLGAWLKTEYIDRGELGVATGAGFYTYGEND